MSNLADLPRFEDTTFTPTEQAKIRMLSHELSITHPNLPQAFVQLLAQVGAVCTEAELAEMEKNL
eukprot:scaffold413_cov134-Isochrysis_galbana.AAC.4